ncbi:MAG: YchJ family protein [Nitrospinota bacterium]|nr:YchJ family protein [Nitrospinota bacterium]
MKECPCGTAFLYTDCCGPIIRGTSHADTAEDLMRSRFTAFAKGKWDYLEKTSHPSERQEENSSSPKLHEKDILWTKLEILDVMNGGVLDEEGEVSFIAYYAEDGEEKTLRETSKFIKENGRWYYSQRRSQVTASPVKPAQPFKRSQPKVGRNDPCPCGSNKKYKKCCGK